MVIEMKNNKKGEGKKGYIYRGFYFKDHEVFNKVNDLCSQLGISMNKLVNEFFRSFALQQNNIQIDSRINQIIIGGVNINVNQNVNQNSTREIKVKIREAIECLKIAMSFFMLPKVKANVKEALEILKSILNEL